MELLLALTRPRVIAAGAILIGAALAADRWGARARARLELLRHPPAPAASALAAGPREDLESRESLRLRGLHRAVAAEIEAARAQGFNVDRLRRLADSALELDKPAYRGAAVERLNRLRLAIPRKKEFVRPASRDEDAADPFEAARAGALKP